MPGVVINTSFDPAQSCGIGNLGIEAIEPGLIRQHLWKTKRIIVVAIGHPDCTGLRVTPNVYTTLDEVDTFIESFEEVVRHGIVE
jgi:selenocysteine lyase/cysteine desulfurase